MRQPTKAFLVTHTFPPPSPIALETVERTFALACHRLNDSGTPIRLLGSSYLPSQQRWLGLILADSNDDVHRAGAIAQLGGLAVTEI